MTLSELTSEAVARFGPNHYDWAFVCPACKHVATVRDWRDAGANEGEVAFSCVGRHLPNAREAFGTGPGPCNYAGGGLFGLNPLEVDGVRYFDLAPARTKE